MKPEVHHFAAVAAEYASCRPDYPDNLFQYLPGLADRHELAWDCAAGSGQATLPLARVFCRVVATDISAAMLNQAPRHPNVEYRVAPAETSGLEAQTVDLVTIAQALHWVEIESFYAEVERVLVPSGVLAAWTYGNQRLDDRAVDAVLQHFYAEVVGPYWAPERRYVESGYQTLPFPFPELKPPTFFMQKRWTLNQLLGYISTWSATQRFRQVVGTDPVGELALELSPLWGDPAAVRTVQWPLSLRVGRRPG
jgi:SAM-dependent methyltransferase